MATTVAELVTHLHANIDEIHKCIEGLSTGNHDGELERLEREREVLIEGIRREHEEEAVEAEKRRNAEVQERLVLRKREEEEILERRRKEDEERQARIEEEERGRIQKKKEEDLKREQQAEIKRKEIQEKVEKELERLEDEMERRVEEGKKQLVVLDEKRKAINAQIDAAMNIPLVIPTVKFRSRAKTADRGDLAALKKDEISAVSDVTPVANSHDAEADIISTEVQSASREVVAPELEVPEPEETQHTVDAEKAWWGADHLKAKKQANIPVPDVSLELNSQPDIQNSFSERKVNIQEASVFPEAGQIQIEGYESDSLSDAETRSVPAEDPEDVRAREEIAMLNAERMKAAVEAEKEEEEVKHGRSLDWVSDASGVYHFSEEDRPHPIFKEDISPAQLYHFSENSRPHPVFIYRFSESQRPAPQFNEDNTVPETYHFSEETRPYPGFAHRETSQEKPNLVPGTYRFSEQARPQPVFIEDTEVPKSYRFSEQQRPTPMFIYNFSEERRPQPIFIEQASIPKIFHFSENSRPSLNFDGRTPDRVIPARMPTSYRFSEEGRPMPLFSESAGVPKTFRFSEQQRPKPNFIYRFSERSRPRPTFIEQNNSPEIYRFFEGKRPSPVFEGQEIQTVSPHLKRGVYSFSEDTRPRPLFTKSATIPSVYHFSEEQRPKPQFFHSFFEETRPLPRFTKEQQNREVYHFSEEGRPSPIFDDHLPESSPSKKQLTRSRPTELIEIYHFTEEERPQPVFSFQAEIPRIFRFSEQQRPAPSLIHRFSEATRPKPSFDPQESSFQLYHFSEDQRPRPIFEDSSSPASIPQKSSSVEMRGIYHFSEEERPAPSFTPIAQDVKVHRFSEENRPLPSFIYAFSEGKRPLPKLDDLATKFKIYRFSEDERPKPAFEDVVDEGILSSSAEETPTAEAETSTPSMRDETCIYHFSESTRPKPAFTEKSTQDPRLYHFSEETRPRPSLTHRFSEEERPLPAYNQEAIPDSVYRFLEENRPRPSFDGDSIDRPEVTRESSAYNVLDNYLADSPLVRNGQEITEQHPFVPEPEVVENQAVQEAKEWSARPSTPIVRYDISYSLEDHIEESPVPVMHAEDLFTDDESDYEEDGASFGYAPKDLEAVRVAEQPQIPASFSSESTVHDDQPSRGNQLPTTGLPSFPEEEEDERPNKVQHQRKTSVFASLVNAIGSDVPLVNRLIPSQEYVSIAPDDYDPYSDAVEHQAEHDSQPPAIPEHSDWQPNEESDGDFPIRRHDTGLHIRTYTVDTVPAFDSYPHSDEEESPATPSDTASSPFVENPGEPVIHSAWSPPREEIHHREEIPGMKPQASPLRADFEHTYPNYVTPQTSLATLRAIESESESKARNSDGMVEREYPSGQEQQFERKPYDLPASATQSLDKLPPSNLHRTNSDHNSPERIPTNSPATSIFQKTRSLFEASNQPQPNTPPSRRSSGIFHMARTSPSPSRLPIKHRPASLYQPQTAIFPDDVIVPKSLDGNGKPPSPAFMLPSDAKRYSQGNGGTQAEKKTFLDGLTRLVGSGGLESSMHNPAREKLLGGENRW